MRQTIDISETEDDIMKQIAIGLSKLWEYVNSSKYSEKYATHINFGDGVMTDVNERVLRKARQRWQSEAEFVVILGNFNVDKFVREQLREVEELVEAEYEDLRRRFPLG